MSESLQPDPTARLASDVDQLKIELSMLRADIDRVSETLKDTGANVFGAAKRQGAEAVGRVRAEAEALADTVTAAGRTQLTELENRIREQPLLAVCVAFGIGMITTLMRGRR